jgi:hypothetical protein
VLKYYKDGRPTKLLAGAYGGWQAGSLPAVYFLFWWSKSLSVDVMREHMLKEPTNELPINYNFDGLLAGVLPIQYLRWTW